MEKQTYSPIYLHYEETLRKHGANFRGMDWPDETDLEARFKAMVEVLNRRLDANVTLLDLGCGVGLLLDYLKDKELDGICYNGIDISDAMVSAAKTRHPNHSFEVRDIIDNQLEKQSFDYVVMNGVLTEKVSLTQDAMELFAKEMIRQAFACCRVGLAFNVMSDLVDWEREDLFHWPVDRALEFLSKECSRHINLRMDYGLYEYTIHVYRTPNR